MNMRLWRRFGGFAATVMLLATLVSCGEENGGDMPMMCEPGGEERVAVLRQIAFILEDPSGVAEGFNLDGVVSDESDDGSCNKPDLTSPSGEPGIDNSLASLWSNLQMLSPDLVAVDSLIQGAIDDGQLLLLMNVDGIDDPMNDECVNITVRRATGMPMLGTDGLITSGQTFDVDTSAPMALWRVAPLNFSFPCGSSTWSLS